MKKIGEIKGVPVVEGNVNEVTRNQIHYKEDSGSIQLSKRGNDNKLNSVTGSSSVNENDNSLYIEFSDDCSADFKVVLFCYYHVISYTIAAYNTTTYHSAISFVEDNPLYIIRVQIFKNKHVIGSIDGNEIQPINSYADFINSLHNIGGGENIDFEHYFQEITAEQYWSNYK